MIRPPQPGNLRRAVRAFHGTRRCRWSEGPNLCPPEAPPLEQVFALVLASWLAFGPSRARYAAVGQARETSEKELILCNLLARRQAMLDLGGFNEALYPKRGECAHGRTAEAWRKADLRPANCSCIAARAPTSSRSPGCS